jgi:hypothetical protein
MNTYGLKNDNAVAGIVVAIMIVGLVIGVLSIVQTVYVPKWMEEREAEHMGKVTEQFSQLKFAIDSLSATHQTIPISTPITLGSKELGFLMSTRAFGTIAIIPFEVEIVFEDNNSATRNLFPPSIKYSSQNEYYLDQSYIYEAGAVILSQSEGNIMTAKPSISVKRETTPMGEDFLNFSFVIVELTYTEGKTSVGGYGTYPIRFQFEDNITESFPLNPTSILSNITIITNYPYQWHDYFNSTLSDDDLNLNWPTDYDISVNDEQVIVTFDTIGGSLDTVLVESIEIIYIDIQIGPGWVD